MVSKRKCWLMMLLCIASISVLASRPLHPIKPDQKYLFYFHGQVVTELGDNAVNNGAPEWGPYEFSNILDSLRRQGFTVISEIRKKGTDNEFYIQKTLRQIDSLMSMGTKGKDILLVGASAGTDIVLRVSSRQKNSDISYVIMGGCRSYTFADYPNMEFHGKFLSITEKSDTSRGTCKPLFSEAFARKNFKEIELHTGLDHGFFYKGRKDWIDPIVTWFRTR